MKWDILHARIGGQYQNRSNYFCFNRAWSEQKVGGNQFASPGKNLDETLTDSSMQEGEVSYFYQAD